MVIITEEILREKYPGNWIVLLSDGRYFVGKTPDQALSQVPRDADIRDVFRSPRRGGDRLLFEAG
jgi:hypothetical protein